MASNNTVTKKMEAFVFSAHIGSKPVDSYEQLIDHLIAIPKESRVADLDNGRSVAVPTITRNGKRVHIVAYEGEKGVNPILFSTQNSSERIERLKRDEFQATKTHAIIDLETKKAVVEYNHRGAKADDIAYVFSQLGRNISANSDLYVQFAYIPGDEFITAIDKLQRVRVAKVRFARPNPGWTDAKNKLSEVADESGAHFVDVEFTASRGEDLETRKGIIDILKKAARDGVSYFKKVEIKGFEPGATKEKNIKLDNYVESQPAAITRDQNGHPSGDQMNAALGRYLNELIRKGK